MGGLADLFFPPRCAGCDLPGVLLCASCAQAVARIDPAAACPRCGAPKIAGRCDECRGRDFTFAAARCAALLEPPVSRAIVLLKDGGERRYATVLATLVAEVAGEWPAAAEALVPIPTTPAAIRRRGFDHAADLVRALSSTTGLPVARVLAARAGADQRALGRGDRFANRKGAFHLAPCADVPARVLLVDDVFTTGATLEAAAGVLALAGAREVRALAVARACRPRA